MPAPQTRTGSPRAECGAIERHLLDATAELLDLARASEVALLLVSNEVGMGIVPAYRLGRHYRDILGRVNQAVARRADVVILMVAGLPVDLKRLVVERLSLQPNADELGEVTSGIAYRVSPPVDNDALNALFAASWPEHRRTDFAAQLAHSLAYLCAYDGDRLVGFVNLAGDGGVHAFLLNPTVHPNWRRRGIGTRLVREAVAVARRRGVEWVHVGYEPHLRNFYARCGFRPTEAG